MPRFSAATSREAHTVLDELAASAKRLYPDRVVVYRGQTREYLVERTANDNIKLFGTPIVLEPSLLPSASRREPLSDIAGAVWAHVVQRHLGSIAGVYAPALRFMETGQAWHHATPDGQLVTLAFAQHYGLPTPAVDVTASANVALWFALNNLVLKSGGVATATPNDAGTGVVYVIAADRAQYFDNGLTRETALRPIRQNGGFMASNWGHCKNRVTNQLIGAVYLSDATEAELRARLPLGGALFPGPTEDAFLALIQRLSTQQRQGSPALEVLTPRSMTV